MQTEYSDTATAWIWLPLVHSGSSSGKKNWQPSTNPGLSNKSLSVQYTSYRFFVCLCLWKRQYLPPHIRKINQSRPFSKPEFIVERWLVFFPFSPEAQEDYNEVRGHLLFKGKGQNHRFWCVRLNTLHWPLMGDKCKVIPWQIAVCLKTNQKGWQCYAAWTCPFILHICSGYLSTN